jgi:hypothetical protein
MFWSTTIKCFGENQMIKFALFQPQQVTRVHIILTNSQAFNVAESRGGTRRWRLCLIIRVLHAPIRWPMGSYCGFRKSFG